MFTVVSTGRIHQALHPDSIPVKFALDIATIKGRPLFYVPDSYYTDAMRTMFDYQTLVSASKWNDAVYHGSTIFKEVVIGDADVVVKMYWEGGGEGCPSHEIACVKPWSGQPHLPDQINLWVRMPPQGVDAKTGKITEWRNKSSDLTDPRLKNLYHPLPFTLMHEFGHTVGVHHLPNGFVMGEEEIRKAEVTPTPNDKHGFTEATRSH